MLNIVELRAIALVRCSRLTISRTKDWRAGMSNAFTTPSRNASTSTCQGATVPVNVRIERIAARSIAAAWVTTSRLRRGRRSATRPPYRVKAQAAAPEANPT